MEIISPITELRARLCNETNIAFVPTMGNLHEGHLDLVRIARAQGKFVVVSIFVNPLQFGPSEDLDKYPRTLEDDCVKLQGLADVVFAPSANEMYPEQQSVFVEPPSVANELCGEFRPGHFRGVATVVLKLLNIVQPRVAVFGKKDYQQWVVVRQMAAQLNLPVDIMGGETVRAPDGLALSSRNQYLSISERTEAPLLYRTLLGMRQNLLADKLDFPKLEQQATQSLVTRGWRVDYVAVRRQGNLTLPEQGECNLVILAAAWMGQTRLIDNLEVCLKG